MIKKTYSDRFMRKVGSRKLLVGVVYTWVGLKCDAIKEVQTGYLYDKVWKLCNQGSNDLQSTRTRVTCISCPCHLVVKGAWRIKFRTNDWSN